MEYIVRKFLIALPRPHSYFMKGFLPQLKKKKKQEISGNVNSWLNLTFFNAKYWKVTKFIKASDSFLRLKPLIFV